MDAAMIFLVLALAALGLALACTWTLFAGDKVAVRTIALAVLGVAVGVALAARDQDVLLHDLTILHEGGTARTIEALFGRDQHVGELWRGAAEGLARPGEIPIAALLRVNLVLALVSVMGLAILAVHVARHPFAAVVALVLVASSRAFWNGLHGETPAPALWFACVTAVPAWRLLDGAQGRPPTQHLLALVSLAVSTGLAVGVREEFVVLGGPATFLALCIFLFGPEPVARAWGGLRSLGVRMLQAGWPFRLAGVVALLAGTLAISWLPFHTRLRVTALLPVLAFQAPAALLAVTPFPVVLLALLGAVASLRGGVVRGLVRLALACLLAVYLVASHGVGWEMHRYGLMAVAMVWAMALAGWEALEHVAERHGWHRSWRFSLALSAFFYIPVPWGVDPTGPAWWDASERGENRPHRLLVDRSLQREARLLVRSLMEAPMCLHVARVRPHGEPGAPLVLVTFGRDRAPAYHYDPQASVSALRAETGSCLRYHRSLDCGLRRMGGRCDDDVRGAREERVVREPFAPYDDPMEYGVHTAEVVYGVWRIDG